MNEFLAAGPVGVLQAVAGAGQVVEMLQRHYHTAVQPRLAVVRSDISWCVVDHDVGGCGFVAVSKVAS